MKYPRLIIAATGSGSGKTTITCGILSALKSMGLCPCSFKCGPDYIDPMFHRNVLKVESSNLDTFFTNHNDTRSIFTDNYSGDIAIIEGVMGLFDGVGGINPTGSTYDLAVALKAPIILVVNARGKGRSILAEIKGFIDYDESSLIKGVILNRTSDSFARVISPLIESELGIKVLGFVKNDDSIVIDSRHLGLLMPEEISDIREKIAKAEAYVCHDIDIDSILDIAKQADELEISPKQVCHTTGKLIRLARAYDEAFCFYYRENMQMFKERGVEIVDFSPIHDRKLPDNIDGILLGGGYPENYLEGLSNNTSMIESVRASLASGIPLVAECGGFMYLMESISDKDGNSFDMVGFINGKAFFSGRLVRFGYVTIDIDDEVKIKGHEFHYFDTDNNGEDALITKPANGMTYKAMHISDGSYIGFPHLYYPTSPAFVNKFVEAMSSYGGK